MNVNTFPGLTAEATCQGRLPFFRIVLALSESAPFDDLAKALVHSGLEPEPAGNPHHVMHKAVRGNCSLILLDERLAGCDAFHLCAALRRRGVKMPILFVTANRSLEHTLQAFNSGADDCVSSDCHTEELLVRICALLRRALPPADAAAMRYRFGDCTVDLFSGKAARNGHAVALTSRELQLLRYLIGHPDRAISREELLREVWGYSSIQTRTVDVHVATLRQKFEAYPSHPCYFLTVRGKGYLFHDARAAQMSA